MPKVMGVDCSTKSIAYAVLEDGKLVSHGEISFTGATIFERLKDAHAKAAILHAKIDPDVVAFESAIMVKSTGVAIKMAYVFGAVIASLLKDGARVIEVAPISWQSFIGNKNLTAHEKQSIRDRFPGKKMSWYQNYGRMLRKQRTMDFARREFGLETSSDNVADSLGVAYWASNKE